MIRFALIAMLTATAMADAAYHVVNKTVSNL